jgi:hypothetical protein
MKKLLALTMIVLGMVIVNLSCYAFESSDDSLSKDSPYIKASDKNGEYHIRPDGTPLYKKRFKEVGDFHEGVAWVQDENKKFFHIDSTGNAIYKQRYLKVYDFVNGYAIVESELYSFHIKKNGQRAYQKNFLEVRNFFDGLAAVEDNNGECFHIVDSTGNPAYKERYTSVGDFHEGYAWVESSEDGKFFHIDRKGVPLYSNRYDQITDFRDSTATAKDGRITILLSIKEDKTVQRLIILTPQK